LVTEDSFAHYCRRSSRSGLTSAKADHLTAAWNKTIFLYPKDILSAIAAVGIPPELRQQGGQLLTVAVSAG